ncbi:4Fe-4S dicluster domain-containing protein [bacterium]|nr:4Fe-4S dicluster domain-containing protein [bacterium]
MTATARARRIIWIRRGVQTLVLLLFLVLLAANRPANGAAPGAPVSTFFDLDPLLMITSWLSSNTLAGISLLGAVTIVVTLILGRVFCGWFCPFGTLHNAVGSLRRQFGRVRPRTSGFSVWQRAKYLVVIALLVMAVFGVQWAGVLDPFALLYRSLALTVLPALDVTVSAVSNAVYLGDPHLGGLHLRDVTEPFYRWWQERVTATEIRVFTGTDVVFLVFVAALVLNLVRNRFWCRYVCPLGGLLGLVSRRPLLRLTSDPSACNQCQKCTMACPAAAQPEKPDEWLATECFGCWNCVAACDRQGLDFRWVEPWRRTSSGSVDVGKRRALASVAAGVGAVAMARITPASQAATYEPSLIRPPGARAEPDFLARCVKCGMCMQTCPSGGLQPTWTEAGLEGLWSPVLVPAIGWCEFECHACGQVCPTGAIEPLPLDEKKQVKIGLAVIDTTRCLPYAYGRECIVCEEHCPVPDKAITFVLEEAVQRDGSTRTLKFPRVDPDRCTGCGICETKCPFRDRAAIRVTSAGEARHPDNQPLLTPTGGGYGDPYGD